MRQRLVELVSPMLIPLTVVRKPATIYKVNGYLKDIAENCGFRHFMKLVWESCLFLNMVNFLYPHSPSDLYET